MQHLSPVTTGPYCIVIYIILSPDWRIRYIWHSRLLHRITFCSLYRNYTARSDWIKPLDFSRVTLPFYRFISNNISPRLLFYDHNPFYVTLVESYYLLFISFVFGSTLNNRICSEQIGLVLNNVIFECERPLLIKYKDCGGLMPFLDLLLIKRTMIRSLAAPILDKDLVVMISPTH